MDVCTFRKTFSFGELLSPAIQGCFHQSNDFLIWDLWYLWPEGGVGGDQVSPLSPDELSGLRLCSSNPSIPLPSDFPPIAQGIAALIQIMLFLVFAPKYNLLKSSFLIRATVT